MIAEEDATYRARFDHELVIHDGPDSLAATVLPFVKAALEEGAPVVVAVRRELSCRLDDEFGADATVPLAPRNGEVRRAAAELAQLRSLLPTLDQRTRVRFVCEMPSRTGTGWHDWRRYEAAVNAALRDLHVWGLCAYDRAHLDDAMLDDLLATHPIVGTDGDHRPNPMHRDPVGCLIRWMDAAPDPVEATPPSAVLHDPTAPRARATAGDLARAEGFDARAAEGLVLAVNEAVTNAAVHGRPPAMVRMWGSPDRVVVTVTDRGTGPSDPFLGLMAPERPEGSGGLGMWIAHQTVDVTHRRHEEGYTVLLSLERAESRC